MDWYNVSRLRVQPKYTYRMLYLWMVGILPTLTQSTSISDLHEKIDVNKQWFSHLFWISSRVKVTVPYFYLPCLSFGFIPFLLSALRNFQKRRQIRFKFQYFYDDHLIVVCIDTLVQYSNFSYWKQYALIKKYILFIGMHKKKSVTH